MPEGTSANISLSNGISIDGVIFKTRTAMPVNSSKTFFEKCSTFSFHPFNVEITRACVIPIDSPYAI